MDGLTTVNTITFQFPGVLQKDKWIAIACTSLTDLVVMGLNCKAEEETALCGNRHLEAIVDFIQDSA